MSGQLIWPVIWPVINTLKAKTPKIKQTNCASCDEPFPNQFKPFEPSKHTPALKVCVTCHFIEHNIITKVGCVYLLFIVY